MLPVRCLLHPLGGLGASTGLAVPPARLTTVPGNWVTAGAEPLTLPTDDRGIQDPELRVFDVPLGEGEQLVQA